MCLTGRTQGLLARCYQIDTVIDQTYLNSETPTVTVGVVFLCSFY
jgi:hypothetical protein